MSLSVIIGAGVCEDTVCATQGVLSAKERKESRRRRAREKEENRRWGQRVKESGRSMRRAGGIRRKSERAVSFGDTVRPALVPVSATPKQPTSENILFRHAVRAIPFEERQPTTDLLDNCSRAFAIQCSAKFYRVTIFGSTRA